MGPAHIICMQRRCEHRWTNLLGHPAWCTSNCAIAQPQGDQSGDNLHWCFHPLIPEYLQVAKQQHGCLPTVLAGLMILNYSTQFFPLLLDQTQTDCNSKKKNKKYLIPIFVNYGWFIIIHDFTHAHFKNTQIEISLKICLQIKFGWDICLFLCLTWLSWLLLPGRSYLCLIVSLPPRL